MSRDVQPPRSGRTRLRDCSFQRYCTAGDDSDLWISEDEQYGVFFSDRDGNAELYEVGR